MAPVGEEKVRELEGVLHDAAGRLSPAHVAALVAHPDAVRSALAVAADVLTTDDEARPRTEALARARRGLCRLVGRRGDRLSPFRHAFTPLPERRAGKCPIPGAPTGTPRD